MAASSRLLPFEGGHESQLAEWSGLCEATMHRSKQHHDPRVSKTARLSIVFGEAQMAEREDT